MSLPYIILEQSKCNKRSKIGIMNNFTLSKPQRRKRVFASKGPPFPVPLESQTGVTSGDEWWYYTAHIVNGCILVRNAGDMEQLYNLGFFGKGSLSRHRPNYTNRRPVIRRTDANTGAQQTLKLTSRRHYLRHSAWASSTDTNPVLDEEEEDLPLPTKNCKEQSLVQECSEEISEPPAKQRRLSGSYCDSTMQSTSGEQTSDPWTMDTNDTDQGDNPWAMQIDSVKQKDPWGLDDDGSEDEKDPWKTTTAKEMEDFWGIESSDQSEKGCSYKDSLNITTSRKVIPNIMDNLSAKILPSPNVEIPNIKDHLDANLQSSSTHESDSVYTDKVNENEKCSSVSNDCVLSNLNTIKENTFTKVVAFDERCVSNEEDANLLVIDDTDNSDVEVTMETRKKWKTVAKKNPFQVGESLQLSKEEAFFLSYALGCLVIHDENNVAQDLSSLWNMFCSRDARFLPKYAVYHNFRSKGWVPKSGLKYGSDFVVYKQGPPFYHSTYSVIVKHVTDRDLRETNDATRRANTWTELSSINRTTEQVSKEVMFCYVIEPENMTPEEKQSPHCLSKLKIQEVVLRRWVSKQERENAEYILIP